MASRFNGVKILQGRLEAKKRREWWATKKEGGKNGIP
jgi:hypothetical protein